MNRNTQVYSMYTKEGNDMVARLVQHAIKYNKPKAFMNRHLELLSTDPEFGEATDTDVVDEVFEIIRSARKRRSTRFRSSPRRKSPRRKSPRRKSRSPRRRSR